MKLIMKRDVNDDYDTSIEEAFGVNDGQVTISLLILILSSYFYNKVIVIQRHYDLSQDCFRISNSV